MSRFAHTIVAYLLSMLLLDHHQGSQVITIVDIPVPIHLPVGLTKATLARWRDSLSYVVVGEISSRLLFHTTQWSSGYLTPLFSANPFLQRNRRTGS